MFLKKNIYLVPLFLFVGLITTAQKKESEFAGNKKYTWEAGVNIGASSIFGDVKSIPQLSYGLFLSKPFTKWFSLNLQYIGTNAKGLNTLSSYNFVKNIAWSDKYAGPIRQGNGTIIHGYVSADGTVTPSGDQDVVFYNYKTSISVVSLTGKFSFSIPKPDPFVSFYCLIGGGIMHYSTKVNTGNANGTYASLFKDVRDLIMSTHVSDAMIKQALQDGMDNSYETNAERHKEPAFCQTVGLGISFTVKKRFVIGIEKSLTFIKTDLLDGQRWQEQAYGDAVLTRDFDYLRMNSIKLSYCF